MDHGEAELGLRMPASLQSFWYARGYLANVRVGDVETDASCRRRIYRNRITTCPACQTTPAPEQLLDATRLGEVEVSTRNIEEEVREIPSVSGCRVGGNCAPV